ncbi:hypothetical protein [Caballeronia sordidicola]|uniref:Uncharacterized protein n=1 Tax=Caballeronia sordidicola TaxID=196367 RepID=A0A226WWU7_CABSO|nr:hypothetical protein [Caballeronia sordidicola]OXC75676.1 hypothetical protein BSU04_25945 [Caballeronia sordidicola]
MPTATPTDAIDKAIELACDVAHESSSDLIEIPRDEIVGLENRLASHFGSQINRLVAMLDELRETTDQLREAFLAASDLDEQGGSATGSQTAPEAEAGVLDAPLGLADWLAHESARAQTLSAKRSAVVRGRVQNQVGSGDQDVALVQSGQLVAVDGVKNLAREGRAPLLRINVEKSSDHEQALVIGAEICLWCERLDRGWQAKIHRVEKDGRIGALVATHRG